MSDQIQPTATTGSSFGKALLWIGGGVVAVLVLLAVIGSRTPEKPIAQRLDEACQQQFGQDGQRAVDECRLRLYMENIAEGERRKMDAARDAAR